MPETQDHGPPPVLLLALTVASGLVDAVTHPALGHVFVANMTGATSSSSASPSPIRQRRCSA